MRLDLNPVPELREMAQQLKAVAVLIKVWSLGPKTHMWQLKRAFNSRSIGSDTLFWPPLYLHQIVHAHAPPTHTHTLK